MKSLALVLEEAHRAPVVTEIDVADPGPGEVMVRLAASGVCGTDGHAVEGNFPMPNRPVVLGHEGGGEVVAAGAGVTHLEPGDHVVLALAVACGVCRQCVRGLPEHCNSALRRQASQGIMNDGRTRASLDGRPLYPLFGVGSLSEYSTVRAEQAIKIDPRLPLREFCLAGCGVITGIGAALSIAPVRVADTVVVLGCGGVGVNVVQGARIAGASKIIAIDTIPERLRLAERLGATHVSHEVAHTAEFVASIEPDGADVVFEVVGRPELVAAALAMTRVGGTCVMVGASPPGLTIPVDAFALFGNRRLVGCRGGAVVPERDIARLAALYESGQLNLADLIGQDLVLAEAQKAFESLSTSAFARSVISFG